VFLSHNEHESHEEKGGTSKWNSRDHQKDITILSMYGEQVKRIRNPLASASHLVDSFQGQENENIVLSPVGTKQ
jgi:superfamily I DNA and/or RNA helicase